ncbi:MAG: CBS domain containing-hemolysin-like protein [Alcanivorax sp.]|jgi:CBS domain containing-hemolysin-like protein
MTLLVTYLMIAIGISFVCSVLEAVLLSLSPVFVETELRSKPRRGKVLKQVRTDLDQSISSILILNTFAHTMGAAGVGAQASKVFGAEWETLIAFLLTLAILYFSEIIPKTLGATFWRQLAIPAAYVIRVLIKLLFPFVWVSSKLTGLFAKGNNALVSREELTALAQMGAEEGSLGAQESKLLENILSLRETRTGQILTPRSVVTALASTLTVSAALSELSEKPFTRIPLFEGNLDNVVGLVFRPVLLQSHSDQGDERKLGELASNIFRVSEELPVLKLLDLFITRREHLFLVEDEYGQTAGVVTLEDALETMLGREIMDESDKVEDMQKLAKSKYQGRIKSDG